MIGVRSMLQSPAYFMILGALCGVVGFRLGWRTRHAVGLPVCQALLGWLVFAASWRARGAIPGALAVAGWALGTTLIAIPVFRVDPERTDRQVLRARPYRESMLDWLRTGRGPESRPWATARSHAVELVLYLGAAVLSANALGIAMGAVLLNYMNAYVAHLLGAARRPWVVRALAWNVWSVVRVAAYILLGAAAAAPISAWAGYPAAPAELRWLVALGAAGVILDLVLKLSLSRPCQRLLAPALKTGTFVFFVP